LIELLILGVYLGGQVATRVVGRPNRRSMEHAGEQQDGE
jgi:hypothetical protein